MTNAEIKEMATKYIINTYGERQIALVKGEGAYVWDADGKKYLDFVAGISTVNIGHCHPNLAKAIAEVLDNCELRRNLSEKGFQRSLEYTLEKQKTRIADFTARHLHRIKQTRCS